METSQWKRVNPSQPNGEYMPEGELVLMHNEITKETIIGRMYSSMGYCDLKGVTHWMKLPCPPKEESKTASDHFYDSIQYLSGRCKKPFPFPKGGHCLDEPLYMTDSTKAMCDLYWKWQIDRTMKKVEEEIQNIETNLFNVKIEDLKIDFNNLAEKLKKLDSLINKKEDKTPITIEGLQKLGFKINQEVGAKYCTYKHLTIISSGGQYDLQTPSGKLNIDYIEEVENLIK